MPRPEHRPRSKRLEVPVADRRRSPRGGSTRTCGTPRPRVPRAREAEGSRAARRRASPSGCRSGACPSACNRRRRRWLRSGSMNFGQWQRYTGGPSRIMSRCVNELRIGIARSLRSRSVENATASCAWLAAYASRPASPVGRGLFAQAVEDPEHAEAAPSAPPSRAASRDRRSPSGACRRRRSACRRARLERLRRGDDAIEEPLDAAQLVVQRRGVIERDAHAIDVRDHRVELVLEQEPVGHDVRDEPEVVRVAHELVEVRVEERLAAPDGDARRSPQRARRRRAA